MAKIYKKLLFDLDNTLVDDNENRRYAMKKILNDRKEEITEENLDNFIKLDDKYWKDRAEGKIKDPYKFKTLEEKTTWVRAQRFIMYFDCSFEEAVEINEKYIEYLKTSIVPIKNAEAILKYLNGKQYEIYIVTNGPAKPVENKLNSINAIKYIKSVFTAEEAGYMKPHREFFDKFFKKINNYQKDDMLIIGDELEKDVLGGIQNGIDSCWFNMKRVKNNTEIKPSFEITNLLELENIL